MAEKRLAKLETAPAESIPYGRNTSVGIFLGIDGGGTKTSCVIGDETSVLGSGTAAGSNVVRLGEASRVEGLIARLEPGLVYGAPRGLAIFHLLCSETEKGADWVGRAIEQRDPFVLLHLLQ